MKAFEGISLNIERRWAFPLVISSVICVFLIATFFNMSLLSSIHTINALISHYSRSSLNQTNPLFVESVLFQPPPPPSAPPLPRFAYLIAGSKGDSRKLWRTLQALYHPRNQYIVHLDLESPPEERLDLAALIDSDPLFVSVGNVHMITKANIVTYRGPTMVSNTLHACAILLKKYNDWDWFINLSASDYPLVTQDGKFCFLSTEIYQNDDGYVLIDDYSTFCRSYIYVFEDRQEAELYRSYWPVRLEGVSF